MNTLIIILSTIIITGVFLYLFISYFILTIRIGTLKASNQRLERLNKFERDLWLKHTWDVINNTKTNVKETENTL